MQHEHPKENQETKAKHPIYTTQTGCKHREREYNQYIYRREASRGDKHKTNFINE